MEVILRPTDLDVSRCPRADHSSSRGGAVEVRAECDKFAGRVCEMGKIAAPA